PPTKYAVEDDVVLDKFPDHRPAFDRQIGKVCCRHLRDPLAKRGGFGHCAGPACPQDSFASGANTSLQSLHSALKSLQFEAENGEVGRRDSWLGWTSGAFHRVHSSACPHRSSS